MALRVRLARVGGRVGLGEPCRPPGSRPWPCGQGSTHGPHRKVAVVIVTGVIVAFRGRPAIMVVGLGLADCVSSAASSSSAVVCVGAGASRPARNAGGNVTTVWGPAADWPRQPRSGSPRGRHSVQRDSRESTILGELEVKVARRCPSGPSREKYGGETETYRRRPRPGTSVGKGSAHDGQGAVLGEFAWTRPWEAQAVAKGCGSRTRGSGALFQT